MIERMQVARSGRQYKSIVRHPPPQTDGAHQIALEDLDDEALVAHENRHGAFEVLYVRYADRILRYCQVRIGNRADAEDTAAHILAKAFHGFPPDGRSTFRSWLFTIAHHAVVDFYRRQGARPQTRSLDLTTDDTADPTSSPEELSLQQEDRHILRRALAALNDDQRQVVELRLAGLKGAEIAAIVGRSHNAVKMLQFRALRNLRDELTNLDPPHSPLTTREEQPDAC